MTRAAQIVLGTAALLLTAFLVKAFRRSNDPKPHTALISNADAAMVYNASLWNRHAVDSALSLLQSGDIVLRRGLGADSYMLAEMNRKDKTYSHCGIVMVEHGYPFVYHCIGGEDNPNQRLRRDSARFFFSPQNNLGLAIVRYDFNKDKAEELRAVVNRYYKAAPLFDLKFDLSTDDRLYCSEFVCKALCRATQDSSYIKPTTLLGHRFVGIDDLFNNDHAAMIWQVRFK